MDRYMPDDVSAELERLAEEQIIDLDADAEDRVRRGRQRRARVATLYAQGKLQTERDFYHASLVMLYGEEPAHWELARLLARRAADLGDPRAWSIIAAAWDRSLLARGQPQRFGTQFIRENGRWTVGRVDPNVTDAERAFYGVPPLWVQRQAAEQLQRREENR
ncbi:hypothetical protein [Roseiflexus castenholzii]|uniref:Uncharacterized protein n=1 Tax=Roseiflexus castenholzii (strain DSM 13941 / HLO8) TaxID=383372 RepID=A7NPA4_ROSCS|nr:hypothetical protein [Roseiflexus castenholzii]ABU59400.1 conserved hypothetical protein [Roseiflexus castenholzii DSM 13941]